MRCAVILVLLVGCFRPPTIIENRIIQHSKIRIVTVPCLWVPPPPSPVDPECGPLSPEDCGDIREARWSDYGKHAELWITKYAWPICTEKQ